MLPKILAREEAALAESQSTPLPSMQAESSTPSAMEAPSTVAKVPRASEWSQGDFIHLLRRYVLRMPHAGLASDSLRIFRIAEVHGPDLDRSYQRDINFRTLQASTPELSKFSYKHCYKTFRAYAKRIDGFETLTLNGKSGIVCVATSPKPCPLRALAET